MLPKFSYYKLVLLLGLSIISTGTFSPQEAAALHIFQWSFEATFDEGGTVTGRIEYDTSTSTIITAEATSDGGTKWTPRTFDTIQFNNNSNWIRLIDAADGADWS